MSKNRLMRWLASGLVAGVVAVAAVSPAMAQEDGSRKVKSRVAPVYPELARKMNVSGTVKLKVTIAPNGQVKDTKVVGGHPLLIDAAQDAIRKWKYEPASDQSTTLVEFKFNPGE